MKAAIHPIRTVLTVTLLFAALAAKSVFGAVSGEASEHEVVVHYHSDDELWVYCPVPEFGIGTHFFDEKDVRAIEELGTRLFRITLYWNLWREDPEVYRSGIDWMVRYSAERDLEPLVVVHMAPPEFGWHNREEAYQAFADDMEEIAARYPSVNYWELWNEQNVGFGVLFGQDAHDWNKELPRFFTQEERGAMYNEMLELAVPAIRRSNPDAWIIVGGTTGSPEQQAGFYRGIYEAGGRTNFDIANVHSYSLPLRDKFMEAGEAVRAVMNEFGDGTKPLINTEFGNSAEITIRDWGITEAEAGPYFDRIQKEQIADVLEQNMEERLYWKVLPYQLVAASEREHWEGVADVDPEFPEGLGWNDFGFGFMRFDRVTPRPVYEWARDRKLNEEIPARREMDVIVELPDGKIPEGHEASRLEDGRWRIANVPVGNAVPTRIRLVTAESGE